MFNLDGPDNVSALRVPYSEILSLEDYWLQPFDFGKILVVNYTAVQREVSLVSNPKPDGTKLETLLKDINSLGKNLSALSTDEGQGNVILETIGPLGDDVLDFIIASNARADVQIQDYKPAWKKVASVFGTMMSFGLNTIVTGHLKSDKDEITGRSKQVPSIFGEVLPSMIPKMFGEVFLSTIISDGKGGIKYAWETKPQANGFIQFLGSRKIDNLPRYMDQDFGYLDKLSKEAKK